jgi:YggT family protein
MENAQIIPLVLISSLVKFLEYYSYILVARILLTWFSNLDWAQQIMGFISPITDPYINLFRFVPPVGMFDLSSMVAILTLQLAIIPAVAALALL